MAAVLSSREPVRGSDVIRPQVLKDVSVVPIPGLDELASAALVSGSAATALERSPHLLTVSPYLEEQHLLDLRTIDDSHRLLALALTQLEIATDEYATAKYEDAFKWSALMARLKALADAEGFRWTRQDFYVVEFRSKLKADIDRPLLFALDKESHAEATQSGGLFKYWFGSPNPERRNLATCVWRRKEDAVAGGKGPWHKKARACIGQMYEEINIKGLRMTIEDDVASWKFEPYH